MSEDTTRTSVAFTAEIVEVKSRKLASLDKEYRMVLISPDPTVNTLGLFDANVLFTVIMEPIL